MYAAIRAALEARLATVVGIPPVSRWAKENEAFEATVGQTWLRARLAPADERLLTLPARGGRKEIPGAWRLWLHFPVDSGVATADTLSAAMVEHFPAGLTLDAGGETLRIDGARRWTGGRDLEVDWYTVPIDVRWHVWTFNTLT